MSSPTTLKKPAPKDWHWADVLATLKKRGWTLNAIAVAEGYAKGQSLANAGVRPYPKAEAIIAAYAGVDHPMVIWPSRYDASGKPNRPMGPKPRHRQPPVKAITPIRGGNPQRAVAE